MTGPVVSARKGFPSPKPLARLLPLLAPYRTRLAVAFVCLLVAAAAGLVFPLVLRFLLDAAFEQKDRVALDRVALALLGVFAVQALMNFVQVYLLSATANASRQPCVSRRSPISSASHRRSLPSVARAN